VDLTRGLQKEFVKKRSPIGVRGTSPLSEVNQEEGPLAHEKFINEGIIDRKGKRI